MDNKDFDFEKAMARLDEIAVALEDGKSTLDTSLSLFEEGVKLVKTCNEYLENCEQKVKFLTEDTREEDNA